MKILHWLSSNICLRAGWKITIHACNPLICPHKKPRNIQAVVRTYLVSQEGAWNAINSSGMTVLSENSSSFGSWYVDNASFCHKSETETPSNQLLLPGENLVRRLFLETFSAHYPWCPSPLSDVYQLSWYEDKYMNNKIQLPPIADPIKWASCGSRRGHQAGQGRRQGLRDLPRELSVCLGPGDGMATCDPMAWRSVLSSGAGVRIEQQRN